jgi:hypothetical protein
MEGVVRWKTREQPSTHYFLYAEKFVQASILSFSSGISQHRFIQLCYTLPRKLGFENVQNSYVSPMRH